MPLTVNPNRSALPTVQGKASTDTPPSAVRSAPELTRDGSFSLGLQGKTGEKDVAAALGKILDPTSAKQYAGFGQKLGSSQGAMLRGVERDMGQWLREYPQASAAEVAAQGKEIVSKHCMIQKTFQDMAQQLASKAIERMKDAFEG